MQLELDGLLKLLPLPTYRWMHARAKQLWKDWVVAGKRFIQRKSNWRKRKVNKFYVKEIYVTAPLFIAGL